MNPAFVKDILKFCTTKKLFSENKLFEKLHDLETMDLQLFLAKARLLVLRKTSLISRIAFESSCYSRSYVASVDKRRLIYPNKKFCKKLVKIV